MGSSLTLVQATSDGAKNCSKDKDCFKAFEYKDDKIPEAKNILDQSKRCCQHTELVTAGAGTDATIDLQKADTWFGYPDMPETFTMICDYDYPKSMGKRNIGSEAEGSTWTSPKGNIYNIYCDGSAQNILVGTIATAGLVVSL